MIKVIRVTVALVVFLVGLACCALIASEGFVDLIIGWGQRTKFDSISRYVLYNAVAGATAWVSMVLAQKISNNKDI